MSLYEVEFWDGSVKQALVVKTNRRMCSIEVYVEESLFITNATALERRRFLEQPVLERSTSDGFVAEKYMSLYPG